MTPGLPGFDHAVLRGLWEAAAVPTRPASLLIATIGPRRRFTRRVADNNRRCVDSTRVAAAADATCPIAHSASMTPSPSTFGGGTPKDLTPCVVCANARPPSRPGRASATPGDH